MNLWLVSHKMNGQQPVPIRIYDIKFGQWNIALQFRFCHFCQISIIASTQLPSIMRSLTSLPPEVLTRIFLNLPIEDCLNLANTCHCTNEILKIDLFWDNKILKDFGINVQISKHTRTYSKAFYKHILFKYRNLLGFWQATSYGKRGGLFQVSIFQSNL